MKLGPILHMLQPMESACKQMRGLVGDLTDFASMRAGKIKIELNEVDPSLLLKDIAVAFELLAKKRDVLFRTELEEPLPRLRLDVQRMRQVLLNLLGNSLKHTPPGQSITLKASVAGQYVRFLVADTGAGIGPKDLSKIFEPFYQSDQPAVNAKEGLGLGLAICQEIVAKHGGTIQAFSEGLGKGTQVEVRIPALRRA